MQEAGNSDLRLVREHFYEHRELFPVAHGSGLNHGIDDGFGLSPDSLWTARSVAGRRASALLLRFLSGRGIEFNC